MGRTRLLLYKVSHNLSKQMGPFNQFISLTVTVRLQVGSYVLGYLYQKGMCMADSEYYTIKLHDA